MDGKILMSFMMLSMIFVFIPRAQASAVRLNEVLDQHSRITTPTSPKSLDTTHPALQFDHVQFRYHHAEEPALSDIDVQVTGGDDAGDYWRNREWENDDGQSDFGLTMRKKGMFELTART